MKLLLFIIITLTSLLFIDSPYYFDSRIIKEVWELGHFVLFAGLVFFLLKSTSLKSKNSVVLIFTTILFCLTVGLATELLQLGIGRNFELKDIFNDLIGGLTGLSAFQFLQHKAKAIRLVNIIAAIILTLIGVYSLIVVIIDERLMQNDFPILATFETPFELTRWNSSLADLSLSKKIKLSGKQAMQANFMPGKYPEMSLNHFIGEWQNYKLLRFNLFNERNESVKIHIKIYDAAHPASGYQYSDRFNSTINLSPGWNQIQYPLATIRNLPNSRPMDLSSIISFSLFLVDLHEPLTIYIDDVYLSKDD